MIFASEDGNRSKDKCLLKSGMRSLPSSPSSSIPCSRCPDLLRELSYPALSWKTRPFRLSMCRSKNAMRLTGISSEELLESALGHKAVKYWPRLTVAPRSPFGKRGVTHHEETFANRCHRCVWGLLLRGLGCELFSFSPVRYPTVDETLENPSFSAHVYEAGSVTRNARAHLHQSKASNQPPRCDHPKRPTRQDLSRHSTR